MELLRAEADKSRHKECCGILLGTYLGAGSTIAAALPAANVHPRPQTHFEIDPQALVNAHRAARAGGPQVLGYYHSHPDGPPHPSATDRAEAAHDGTVWAIVAPGEGAEHDVSFWRDDESGFTALPYAIDDG
ncbi:M67 family metallopeptidase [Aurantiacibacter rhizosphaerae]|nr:M67 family metallopeptidase [Aurantiacibacter rhizosphaerae]